MTQTARIKQIIPALPGWFAIRCKAGEAGARSEFDREPIVAWALLDTPADCVTALAIFPYETGSVPEKGSYLIFEQEDFVGYDYPGCPTNWSQACQDFYQSQWDPATNDWAPANPMRPAL